MTFDEFITNQIRDHNVDLTIVSGCFALGLCIIIIFSSMSFSAIDSELIRAGHVSILENGNTATIVSNGLNRVGYLFMMLSVWFIINMVQMICLAIDEVVDWRCNVKRSVEEIRCQPRTSKVGENRRGSK